MPRFGFDNDKPNFKFDFSQNSNQPSLGKETGDASFSHSNENFFKKNDESKSVSKQKMEFTCYMNSKERPLPTLEPREMPGHTHSPPWDYNPDIKSILEPDQKDKDNWLDKCAVSAGSDGDHFNKVYNARSPSAEKAATLLDELIKLRGELFDRVKELAKFKQDVREAGRMIKEDPWKKIQTGSNVSLQQSSARADKVLDSVELATHRIESVCEELDQGSSQTYLSATNP